MEFFLVELPVSDWPASLAWYRDRLGLAVELLDDGNRYALLRAGAGRIALKPGPPGPAGPKLVFRVANLDAELARLADRGLAPAGPTKSSTEGYRSARFADPDGHAIELFEWTQAR